MFAGIGARAAPLQSAAMKSFQIFKPGTHTASSGTTLSFTEEQLQAAVAAYDPALHEAPIVVGHPRDNGPAYGWVKSLSFSDGAITAEPIQVDADFAEMVQAGRFKKRSASWYLPDAPNNPKPGTLYLRHVGFLGAQPPAVKGLKEVAFSEEEGVIEFNDSAMVTGIVAMMMRRLREFFIAEYGTEKADSVMPDFLVADIEAEARKPAEPEEAEMPMYQEEDPMKIEELQAQVAALTAERDELKTKAGQAADFAEREETLKAREAAVAQAEAAAARDRIEARVDAAVKAGRLLPAQRANAVEFAAALTDGEQTLNFGEGEQAAKVSPREHYLRQIEAAPKVVEYGEQAGGASEPPANAGDPQAVADKARELVTKAAAEGKAISFTEAVAQVMQTTAE